jgi:hypothetical protein
MKINKLIALMTVFVLLFATAGTAFAEEGDVGGTTDTENTTCEPDDTECVEDSENGDGWVHPIIALISAYLEYQQGDSADTPDDTGTGDGTDGGVIDDSTGTTGDETTTPLSFEDELAALHAEGVGFGVLVKLLSMSDKGDTPLSTLVDEFKNGQGFKQLYEDYGNSTKKGVGHVKQELKCADNGGDNCDSLHGNSNNNGKGKNKEGKPGKGNNKP